MLYIIGQGDQPLYEMNLGIIKKEISLIHFFLIHSSLDLVDELNSNSNQLYLKAIEKTGEFTIYGYNTPSSYGHKQIPNFYYCQKTN